MSIYDFDEPSRFGWIWTLMGMVLMAYGFIWFLSGIKSDCLDAQVVTEVQALGNDWHGYSYYARGDKGGAINGEGTVAVGQTICFVPTSSYEFTNPLNFWRTK